MAADSRDITLVVEIKAKGDGAKRAAAELDKIDKSAVGAADAMKGANVQASKFERTLDSVAGNVEGFEQSLDHATRSARTHEGQMKLMREEYDKTRRSITELNAELLNTNSAGRSDVRRKIREQRTYLTELQQIAKEFAKASGTKFSLGDAGGGAASAGAGAMGRIGGMPAPLVAGLVGAVTAAAPLIGSIIGGAVIGAVGTGGMALGLVSAAKDSRVQAAAEKFGQDISAQFFQGGEAFVQPAIDGLAILKDAFYSLDLDETLAKAAPTVVTMAEGFADFAKNLKPGLDKTLARIGPFAEVAADGIGEMGDALGDMIDMISSSKGSLDGLRAMFGIVNGSIRLLGASIEFLENRFHEVTNLVGIFTELGSHTGFSTLDQGLRQITGRSTELSGQMTFMGTASGQAAEKAHDLANGLGEVETEAFGAIDALKQYDDQLAGRANGQIAFEQSLDDLADGFKEFGHNINIDTQHGRDNMKNFEDAIGDAKKVRDDLLAQGKIEEANAAYQRMVARIREVMIQAHFTKAEIDLLLGPHEIQIGITYKERNRPSFINRNLSEPAQDIARRAGGGPVTAGQPYIVGDGGRPELFVPGRSGYILPSVPSAVSGGYGGGNARPLVISPSGNPFADQAFEWLRTEISSRGGTLAVLGLRS